LNQHRAEARSFRALNEGLTASFFGLEPQDARARDLFLPGQLATLLPPGIYRFANSPYDSALAALSWALSGYRFGRYKSNGGEPPKLCVPDGIDAARIERIARGVTFGRDLINTPANDMDPEALEAAVLILAGQYKAKFFRGDELLQAKLPLIHSVGQAAAKPPRLAEFRFGNENRPK
jgi:leucyl aminopeptidase